MVAAWHGHTKVVRLLIAAGVNVNQKDSEVGGVGLHNAYLLDIVKTEVMFIVFLVLFVDKVHVICLQILFMCATCRLAGRR